MILLKQNTTGKIIVTLNESKTISAATFVFVFTNITTQKQITLTYLYSQDLSHYPSRYNEFDVVANAFTGQPTGQYDYTVTELQTNIILEVGKMVLQPATEIIKNGYNEKTQRSGYAG